MDKPTELNVKAGIALPAQDDYANSGKPGGSSRSKSGSNATKRTTRRSAAESASRMKAPEPPATPESTVCLVCFDEEQQEMLGLSCGHKFCTSCWTYHIRGKIRDEGEINIGCMASDCSLLAPDSFVFAVVGDGEGLIARHQELVVRHYVGCNKNLKFCPYPSCTYTVSCPAAASKSALTSIVPAVRCGASETHKFCFGCSIEADHRPVVCNVAKLWLKKCQDDSETANWIKSNTKECSKCQSTIEKNGGCKWVLLIMRKLTADVR